MGNFNKSVLINPIVARSKDEPHRAATPLELFYDLIFVVAIASLAATFHHAITEWHHVDHAVFMFFWIFWCIWWPWNSYTWLASGYDTDDAQFRLASFAQMVGVIIIAVGVEPAFKESDFLVLTIGYVILRIPFIFMWLKIAYDDVVSRPVALRYSIGVFILQICWTVSVLYYPSWYIFGTLLVLEMLVPYFAESSIDKGKNTKYHHEHIEERLGLLTIIVLGESILASVYAMQKVFDHYTPELGILTAATLLILFSMWWLYFDDKVEDKLENEFVAFVLGYGHYFIFAAATAVGAMISVNVDVVTNHAVITQEHAILGLAVAIAVYLISVWLCHDLLLDKKGVKRYELLILAGMVIVIALTVKSILLMALSFVALNAIRLIRRHREHSRA